MNDVDNAFTKAINDAVLYGHGFIRITNNNGLEAHHIKQSEFDAIAELFDWIKKNRVEIENETPQQKGGDEEQTASKS